MSNLDSAPAEVTCVNSERHSSADVRLLTAREVPLGGPRGMTVHRTLPQRAQSLIGAWCFVDHYGPDDVSRSGGMRVPGHPHTGLQTVSWLFAGEVEHRDTTGGHAVIGPGELSLMTAGAGIAHSEYSVGSAPILHGVQLWVALPERTRFGAPRFDHHVPVAVSHGAAELRVFLGTLAGQVSPVSTHTPLLGAEVLLPAGQRLVLDADPGFEYGVLVDRGEVTLGGVAAAERQLLCQDPGAKALELCAPRVDTRFLLLGGEPLGEQIVMWWNFVGRSHAEIVTYRERWEQARVRGGSTARDTADFGVFPRSWEQTLPAPQLPQGRLRPRG
ncbi:pirin family protein [Lipingzhangella sp. LS1_29]|uniref:Pirin family protein n=1 Tax=Lipingzhangella rawalii TaxID=2055835 RepID=A0ABU2H6W8_9ACTN|nr:pirin family protein [Lipingzhangella rawalii]MDS1271045.1 pirin family protein [Lipingzhangella rawalii]